MIYSILTDDLKLTSQMQCIFPLFYRELFEGRKDVCFRAKLLVVPHSYMLNLPWAQTLFFLIDFLLSDFFPLWKIINISQVKSNRVFHVGTKQKMYCQKKVKESAFSTFTFWRCMLTWSLLMLKNSYCLSHGRAPFEVSKLASSGEVSRVQHSRSKSPSPWVQVLNSGRILGGVIFKN